jgi:hypothetical protein
MRPPVVIIPINGWNRIAERALRFGLLLSDDITAVHVSTEGGGNRRRREFYAPDGPASWHSWLTSLPHAGSEPGSRGPFPPDARGISCRLYGLSGGQSRRYVRSRLINLQNRLCSPLLVWSW